MTVPDHLKPADREGLENRLMMHSDSYARDPRPGTLVRADEAIHAMREYAAAALPPAAERVEIPARKMNGFRCHNCKRVYWTADDHAPARCPDCRCREFSAVYPSASDPKLPAGMKPWHGGDSAPADWDGGDVLWQTPHGLDLSGTTAEDRQWQVFDDDSYNIIAYTPATSAEQPTAPSPEWCLRMAALEDGQEVGAGGLDHPLRVKCERPPSGWLCTREPGHGGPCAAEQPDQRAGENARAIVEQVVLLCHQGKADEAEAIIAALHPSQESHGVEGGASQAERECQAVWRCAVGDVTSALDVLKNKWVGSKRKAEREAGAVLSGVLDLVWAYRDPAAGSYAQANANGKVLTNRIRAALGSNEG